MTVPNDTIKIKKFDNEALRTFFTSFFFREITICSCKIKHKLTKMRIALPSELEHKVKQPLQRAVAEENPLFETSWDLPVDETNWMSPLMTVDAIHINQDFSAFQKVFSNTNPNCKRAKTFIDSYIKMGTGEVDTKSFFEAYKSIAYIERQLNAKNRENVLVDLGNVLKEEYEFTHRIHRFMAVAVSYLINQYNHDVKAGRAGKFDATNIFDVLCYEKKAWGDSPREVDARQAPLCEEVLFVQMMKKNKVAWLLPISKLKRMSVEIFNKENGLIWQRLMAHEYRYFLLSMYRYSVVYYKYQPRLFTDTMENMCLFWQLYAEMKGKIVTLSDIGLTKWFAPFEFDVPLTSYLSKKTDGNPAQYNMLYSTQKLANCSLGVESFYCFCYYSTFEDEKETLVFIPHAMKVSLKALKRIKDVEEEDETEPHIFIRRVIGKEFEIPE